MQKPTKIEVKPAPKPEPEPEPPKAETELDRKLKEQKGLLALKESMDTLGIDRLNVLEAKLSIVNQRVKELS